MTDGRVTPPGKLCVLAVLAGGGAGAPKRRRSVKTKLSIGDQERLKKLMTKGDEAVASGDHQVAAEAFEEVLALDRGNLEAGLKRGRALLESGLSTLAREAFGEVLSRHPDNEEARSAMQTIGDPTDEDAGDDIGGQIQEARALLARKKPRAARKILRAVLADQPDHSVAARLLEECKKEITKRDARKKLKSVDENMASENWEEAIKDIEDVVKAFPTSKSALLKKAEILVNLGRGEEARRILNGMPARGKDPGIMALLERIDSQQSSSRLQTFIDNAKDSMKNGDPETALRYYQNALQADPKNVSVLLDASYALQEVERFEEANLLIIEAEKHSPDDPDILAAKQRFESRVDDLISSSEPPEIARMDTTLADSIEKACILASSIVFLAFMLIGYRAPPDLIDPDELPRYRETFLLPFMLLETALTAGFLGLFFVSRNMREKALVRSLGRTVLDTIRSAGSGRRGGGIASIAPVFVLGGGFLVGAWGPTSPLGRFMPPLMAGTITFIIAIAMVGVLIFYAFRTLSFSHQYRQLWLMVALMGMGYTAYLLVTLLLVDGTYSLGALDESILLTLGILYLTASLAYAFEQLLEGRIETDVASFKTEYFRDRLDESVYLRRINTLALNVREHPSVLILEGNFWLRKGEEGKAMNCFQDVLRMDPTNSEAWLGKGNVEKARGMKERKGPGLENAARSLADAVGADPTDPVAWNNLGNARFLNGDLQGAISAYDKAIELAPNYVHPYNNKGLTLIKFGKYSDAVDNLDKAIKLRPGLAEAYRNKHSALTRIGRNEEAKEALDRYRKLKEEEREERETGEEKRKKKGKKKGAGKKSKKKSEMEEGTEDLSGRKKARKDKGTGGRKAGPREMEGETLDLDTPEPPEETPPMTGNVEDRVDGKEKKEKRSGKKDGKVSSKKPGKKPGKKSTPEEDGGVDHKEDEGGDGDRTGDRDRDDDSGDTSDKGDGKKSDPNLAMQDLEELL